MTPPLNHLVLETVGEVVINKMDCERFPARKHPRLKSYDYSTPNYYFITICTWQKTCLVGAPGELNASGKIAEQGILEIANHFPNVQVDKFVVMPNHIHLILVLHAESSPVSDIIGQYKAFVTKEIRKTKGDIKVWQTSFHDHVIRNQRSYEKIWLYIEANPDNWEKDCFFEE